jgi:uncharacterized protein
MRAWLAKSLLLCLIAGSAPYQGDDQQKNGKAADKSAGTAAFKGIWEGILSVPPGLELQIVFKVTTTKGGEAKATLDIPDENARGIPLSTFSVDGDEVTFGIKELPLEFKGKRDAAGTAILGNWKQGPTVLPLTLMKVASATQRRRPQTPKPPFPYKTEDVLYPSKATGVHLAGTLTLPQGKAPFPAVLMITGSGPQDRDESIVGHRPFLVLADALTRRGIAVLRSDDRGVGRSTGAFDTATSADFADDAEGGLNFLKGRPEIDPKKLGLLGHSEGGVIGPMVAARAPDHVAFLVLLAGTGVSGESLANAQQETMLRAAGATEETIKTTNELLKRLLPILLGEKDPKLASEKMSAAVKAWLAEQSEATRKSVADQDLPTLMVQRLSSPWLRYFLALDPRKELARVKCPVLAINGELDSQVAFRENLDGIAKALKDSGNDRVTTRSFPQLNHLFQSCKTGALSEYARIEETMNPEVLKTITDWVVDHASKP